MSWLRWDMLVVAGTILAAGLAGWLVAAWRQRATRMVARKVLFLGRHGDGGLEEADFIGRDQQQREFQRLLDEWARPRPQKRAHLLVVAGPPGVGRRELLRRFRVIYERRAAARCGPLLEMKDQHDEAEVMATIAAAFQQRNRNAFRQFMREYERFRGAGPGRPRPLTLGVQAARDTAALLHADTVKSALESKSTEQAVSLLEGQVDLPQLEDRFIADLAELAARQPRQPVALFFANFDALPDDRTVVWLRRRVLPNLASSPVLVAVSVGGTGNHRDLLPNLGPETPMELRPLTTAERIRYVEHVIKLRRPELVQQVVERSEGMPSRLAGYHDLFERRPELRDADQLPEGIEADVGSDAISILLRQVKSPFLQRLTLAAAITRWFNAALLEELAAAAGLTEQGKQEGLVPADLLVRERRPSWVTAAGGGWGIEAHRSELAEEYRRLDPSRFRLVHLAAARYHHRQLLAWEGRPVDGAPEDAAALVADLPSGSPTERFDDPDRAAVVTELHYHLLALDPAAAFPALVDQATEALVLGKFGFARRLLDVGPELRLRSRQARYLRLLGRAATALDNQQYAEARRLLRDLLESDAPTPLTDPGLRHILGIVHHMNGDANRAVRSFELARRGFEQLPRDDRRVIRLRCMNAQWVAIELAWATPAEDHSREELLQQALADAEHLGEAELLADLLAARAIVLDVRSDPEEAVKSYGAALERVARTDPVQVASLSRLRARSLVRIGEYERAEADLDRADAIYGSLNDTEGQAQVQLTRIALAVARDDQASWKRHREALVRLRPNDSAFYNQAGIEFAIGRKNEDATALYEKAIELAPRIAVYHANRARSLAALGHRPDAIDAYRKAVELESDDPVPLSELLALVAEDADPDETSALARRLGQCLLRLEATDPSSPDERSATRRFPDSLRPLLDEAVQKLPQADAVALLRDAVKRCPGDSRLRYDLYNRLVQLPDARLSDTEPLEVLEDAVACDEHDPPEARIRHREELANQQFNAGRVDDADATLRLAKAIGSLNRRGAELEAQVQRRRRPDSYERPPSLAEPLARPVVVLIAQGMRRWFDKNLPGPLSPAAAQFFDEMLPDLRQRIWERSGVSVPGIRVRDDPDLPEGTIQIWFGGVLQEVLRLDGEYLAEAPGPDGLDGRPTTRPWDGGPGTWVAAEDVDRFRERQVPVWDPRGIVAAQLGWLLEEHRLAALVGVDTVPLLGLAGRDGGWSPVQVASLLRRLLIEGVPVADRGAIGDSLGEVTAEAGFAELLASARRRLVPAAAAGWLPPGAGELRAVALAPALEERLLGDGGDGGCGAGVLRLPEPARGRLVDAVGAAVQQAGADVLAVRRPRLRPHLFDLLRYVLPRIKVVTPEELGAAEYAVAAEVDL